MKKIFKSVLFPIWLVLEVVVFVLKLVMVLSSTVLGILPGQGRVNCYYLQQVVYFFVCCSGNSPRESTSDLFLFQSLADGVCDQRRRHIGANLPCQYNLSAQVQHGAQIQHAARNRNVGDVCDPELIRHHLVEATVQQIGILVNGLLVASVWSAAAHDRQQT